MERYRIPGPTLTLETSLPGSLEENGDAEAQQDSEDR
jgi:hypothetical protein